jgi:nitrate reductase alpha subunit
MYVTRRQFLKLSGAAGIGLYLASQELSLWALEPVTEVDNPLAYYPARDWEKLYRDPRLEVRARRRRCLPW